MGLSPSKRREISLKVVYYGPGLAGKATSLQYLHAALRADARGQLFSVVTGGDRTLFFDFFPPPSPRLQGNALRLQLYTTPGEVRSDSTHRALLEGVDAVVFVADSQEPRVQDNVESLERLREGLGALGLSLSQLPHVFAWNKRDLEGALPVEELQVLLNRHQAPAFETVATTGRGVFDTLKAVTGLLVTDLTRRRVRHSNAPGSNGSAARRPTADGALQERSGEVRRGPDAAEMGLLNQPTYLRPRADEVLAAAVPTRVSKPSPPPPEPSPGSAAPGGPAAALALALAPLADPALLSVDTQQQQTQRRSPTWLQPLAPEQGELPSTGTRPLWLSQITPSGPIRDQLHGMELDLATGHYAQAVRRATAIFHNLTQNAADLEAEEGHAWRALALGIPVDRYLRFRDAVRHAEVGTATLEDGLFALFFLLDTSLRR